MGNGKAGGGVPQSHNTKHSVCSLYVGNPLFSKIRLSVWFFVALSLGVCVLGGVEPMLPLVGMERKR